MTERHAVDDRGAGGAATAPGVEMPSGAANEPSTPSGNQPPDARSCSCDVQDGEDVGARRVSLQCFCEAFPDACPSYEEARQGFRYGAGDADRCDGAPPSWVAERIGCGRRIFQRGAAFADTVLYYDEESLELVGAYIYNDTGFGPCGAYVYSTGQVAVCSEGTVCSLCEETCWPRCSLEDYDGRHWGRPTYADWERAALERCPFVQEGEPIPTLITGCGRVTVRWQHGEATFSEEARDLLSLRWNGVEECGGQWGDAPPPCEDETRCVLCEDGCGR